MATRTGTKVITGKVRFSYAQVFKPSAMNEGDTKKYSVALLISKKDKSTIAMVKEAIEEAKKQWSEKCGGTLPKSLKVPLRDGDDHDNDEYSGHFFINASTVRKPEIVDVNGHDIADPEDFYSGCYGKASINFYPYNKGGGKGIAAGLGNLMKLEDGENLGGGGASAASDFGFEEDDNDDLM